jgi:xanthine dehydrogenase large subunit
MNKPEALPLAEAVVGRSLPHESAHLHVSGAAPYTDDLPESAGTLHAALGLSPVAHGKLLGVDVDVIRRQPGVVAVLTAADIAGENNCGPLQHDDPILADGELRYVGQPVFAIIATHRELARRAASLARQVIRAEPLPAVLTALEAHAAGQYVLPPMHLTPARHMEPRRPGAVLPGRPDQPGRAAGRRRCPARPLLDPASE